MKRYSEHLYLVSIIIYCLYFAVEILLSPAPSWVKWGTGATFVIIIAGCIDALIAISAKGGRRDV